MFTWREIHVAHICSTWLWQKESKCEPPTPPGLKGNLWQTVTATTATALIKPLMIGFQLRWNLSSHIITCRQLALAESELQPSGPQTTHSDPPLYSTGASWVVFLVLLKPLTTTSSLTSEVHFFAIFSYGCGNVVCRLAQNGRADLLLVGSCTLLDNVTKRRCKKHQIKRSLERKLTHISKNVTHDHRYQWVSVSYFTVFRGGTHMRHLQQMQNQVFLASTLTNEIPKGVINRNIGSVVLYACCKYMCQNESWRFGTETD